MEENKLSTVLVLKYSNIVDGKEKTISQRFRNTKLDATSLGLYNVSTKIEKVIFAPSVTKLKEEITELI